MSNDLNQSTEALKKAKHALQTGDRKSARRWAQTAVAIDPQLEEAWLVLAALSTPESSLQHLNRALKINPNSIRAIKGVEWASRRLEDQVASSSIQNRKIVNLPIPIDEFVKKQQAVGPWILIFLIFLVGLSFLNGRQSWKNVIDSPPQIPLVQAEINKETRTPLPTITSSPTPRPTSTIVPTQTPIPTFTLIPTQKPTATHAPVAKVIKKPKPKKTPLVQIAKRPSGIETSEHWIDIDLSSQTAHALIGDNLVKDFIVSTGTWIHPTVVGTFNIYVKYRYANMTGPGYFLPDVPYVMYFYKDYGLHGTYWHSNFGTPMSHGCINFKIRDAAWLYDFASLGTVVNIHK